MSKILVIDDNENVRAVLIEVLEGEGYQVVSADNGRHGVDLFRSEKPDLVITDLIMPEKEGIETIREIRTDSPAARIIAISGGGRSYSADYLKLARALGASDVIKKPFDPDDLAATVRNRLAAA